ncbi:MAG: rod shape-determining protein MreD [Acidimicrobiales bacterium]|nr:rod shape-determining protein MreD [Acidimicrobiales bacterium]
MLAGSRLRLALVLFGGLVLQTAVVPHFAVAGRIVDVMLLLAVCAGMLAGPERGATVGFFAGVGTDLIVQTPFGMWALAATLTGYGVGVVYGGFVAGGRLVRWVTIAGSLAIGTITFVLIGRLIGQEFLGDVALVPVVATVSLGGTLLSPWAMRAMAWGLNMDRLPWDSGRR